MKALHRQMKEKSIKTRQGCFALLTELILVLPGALASHMNLLVPGVQFSLASSQSNSNMKIDTLSFVQVYIFSTMKNREVFIGSMTKNIKALLSGHHPTVFHPHAAVLVPAVITAVSDTFYKISSEALVVLQLLVKVHLSWITLLDLISFPNRCSGRLTHPLLLSISPCIRPTSTVAAL